MDPQERNNLSINIQSQYTIYKEKVQKVSKVVLEFKKIKKERLIKIIEFTDQGKEMTRD